MAARAPANQQQQRANGAANAQPHICQFKLVLLGESAVGKSSLVLRFVKGQFHEYQESTIGGMYNSNNESICCEIHYIIMSKKSHASNLSCSKKILLVDWMDRKHPNAVSTCSKKRLVASDRHV